MSGANGPGGLRVAIEPPSPLSRSALWELQRRYFAEAGLRAWHGEVPHYITTNSFFAEAYARTVLAYLRDLAAAGLDPAEPVYIVELGAGAGRFAYAFLQALHRLLPAGSEVVYVMSDFAEATVEAWRAHPTLRAHVERGRLDFARFDVAAPGPLTLVERGLTLEEGPLANPLVLIANYLFDSVPQDCFAVRDGTLYECRASLTGPVGASLDDPDLLGAVELAFEEHATTPEHYGDPAYARVLDGYRRRLADTVFVFPIAGLRCLRHFERLAGGRLLLLAADKGHVREDELRGGELPRMVRHANACSFTVNFHALGSYADDQGGEWHTPGHYTAGLVACAFVLGPPAGGLPELARAYADELGEGGADALYTALVFVRRGLPEAGVDELLAVLGVSRWDSEVFLACLPHLLRQVTDVTPAQRRALRAAVARVWEGFLPIGEREDLSARAGGLLHDLGCFAEAGEHLLRSWEREPDASTALKLGECAFELGDEDAARQWAEFALALDPGSGAALALRGRLDAAE